MAAYVVVLATPRDADKMQKYRSIAQQSLASFEGEVAAEGQYEKLNGKNPNGRIAVLQFPDSNAAKIWYNSENFQALLPMRKRAMGTVFVLGGE